MSNTIFRPSEISVLNEHQQRLNDLEAGCPPFVEPASADFENGYDHAGFPYELWGYRICDGGLEFKGHLMPGTSGSTAFTFSYQYLIFPGDVSFLTDIVNGGSFSVARIAISMSTGALVVTFPAV